MDKAQRIVSLLPSATEIVCALGLEERLVGVTHECDYPPTVVGKPVLTSSRISHERMSSEEIDHAVRAQLDGHGSIYELNERLLDELKPDLIITQELCEVCAVSYQTVLQAARVIESEARVVSLEPNNIEDIFANIRTVGELAGAPAEADALVRDLTVQLDALAVLLTEVETRPRTLVLEWLEPPFAPGHWVPEQVAFAGGDASFGNAGGKSRATTAEEILSYAPEVIVLAPCGYYKEDVLRALGSARMPRGWHTIPAVREGRVWAVDATSYFSRPGPRFVEGAEILLRVIHPEMFGEPDTTQAVRVHADLMLAEAP
ncbi:MAG: iron complex transport system substrate-binding protein [Acidobacteriota bacterium]|jgi:iron complex transport system substrate-binding protein|nr:iron complex transport system substrate-binding protein [Acidobacteriota bacterium]